MEQSDRIKYYLEYQKNSPLKQEFLKEKKKIRTKRITIWGVLQIILLIITIIAFFVCGHIFFDGPFLSSDAYYQERQTYSFLAGVINLIIQKKLLFELLDGGFDIKNTNEYEELKKKYLEKGLFVVEDTPYDHECSDWDDYDEHWVCSVTKEWQSAEEHNWCRQKGNCQKCARLHRALGDSEKQIKYLREQGKIEKW